ncbi:MAG: DUF6754 domain-containing protein [Candidatus Eisenbacteria bacterium]
MRDGRTGSVPTTSASFPTSSSPSLPPSTGSCCANGPAANIFLGSFFAESLMLAETGFMTGAIQIAGTANIHQLPFFVVACDYTMIGEEFFATSAYLSREPMLVGTLKGSDAMKLLIMLFLILGAILATTGNTTLNNLLIIQ